MRSLLMALVGVGVMVALARADDTPCAKCDTCHAKGKCVFVDDIKKTKTPVYDHKVSEFCPSTVSANSPCWAAICRLICGDTHGGPRTKKLLVKKYEEKEEVVKKLKVEH